MTWSVCHYNQTSRSCEVEADMWKASLTPDRPANIQIMEQPTSLIKKYSMQKSQMHNAMSEALSGRGKTAS